MISTNIFRILNFLFFWRIKIFKILSKIWNTVDVTSIRSFLYNKKIDYKKKQILKVLSLSFYVLYLHF